MTPILQRQKKAELIKQKIRGSSLQQIAQNQNISVETANSVNRKNPTLAGAGNEPEVVGAAFGLEPGQVSKPIAGNRGVYIVELSAVNKAPQLESYRTFANQQTAQRRQGIENRVF